MPKITPRDPKKGNSIVVKTKTTASMMNRAHKWWKADTKEDRGLQLIETASFLKDQQQYRYRQAGIWSRLYGNMPLFNFVGSQINKMSDANNLPIDRPTMNVVQSCVDTLVSRVTQSRPRPIFLTDDGDYKERNIAKKMNNFIEGEIYRTKAYRLGEFLLRDAIVLGTGCWKIYESPDHKVCIDRVIQTELLVDPNDALYGDPRQFYQLKLVDRDVLAEIFPEVRSKIAQAESAFPDTSAEASKTVSDQVMIIEGWHLPSSPDAGDGRHTIACTAGTILDEEYDKDYFPFIFLHYSERLLGFWGQGLPEQLMGTQVEINKLLMTISSAITLVGVPRVFVEHGSKVVKAHLNNQVGSIVTYRGTKPTYEVAPCMAPEIYAQLQRLIDYAYQQSGISSLAAASQKPAGLTAAAALREYDDLQSDRFASLVKRYDNVYVDLAYKVIDLAKDIAEREKGYETVFPNKKGAKKIELPDLEMIKDPYVIQCFDASALPRDPAGRQQKVTEMAQAGMINMQEARRLLDFPDLEQVENLANAAEERILQILDEIVEDGKYTPPDPFMDLQLANQLVTQYYNLYAQSNLEEDKAELLRTFHTQVLDLVQQASTPPPQAQLPAPAAVPQAPPQSELLPNNPAAMGMS